MPNKHALQKKREKREQKVKKEMPMRLRRTSKRKEEKEQKKAPYWTYSFVHDDAAKRLIRVGVSELIRSGRNTENSQGLGGFTGGTPGGKNGLIIMMVSLHQKIRTVDLED